MSDDMRVLRTFIVAVACVIGSIVVACTIGNHLSGLRETKLAIVQTQALAEMVKGGADPLMVRCAMDGSLNATACILIAAGKQPSPTR